jgi:hypothetical protein
MTDTCVHPVAYLDRQSVTVDAPGWYVREQAQTGKGA